MTHVATVLVPTLACLVISMASSGVQRRLAPAAGAALLTVAAIASASAVLLALGAVAFAFVAEVPRVADVLGWCRQLAPVDDHVPVLFGVAALVVLLVSFGRTVRHVRNADWCTTTDAPEVVVKDSPMIEAFAIPGEPGVIVVTTSLLDVLDPDEREAMLAHERAHLRHGHHRFLILADCAATAVPLVRPISARVRFCTERWADESAAASVGSRSIVARAIAKAAVAAAGQPPQGSLALIGLGVPARLEALGSPGRRAGAATSALLAISLTGLALSIGASTLQLHHLVGFARHVCPG